MKTYENLIGNIAYRKLRSLKIKEIRLFFIKCRLKSTRYFWRMAMASGRINRLKIAFECMKKKEDFILYSYLLRAS